MDIRAPMFYVKKSEPQVLVYNTITKYLTHKKEEKKERDKKVLKISSPEF